MKRKTDAEIDMEILELCPPVTKSGYGACVGDLAVDILGADNPANHDRVQGRCSHLVRRTHLKPAVSFVENNRRYMVLP